MEDVLSSVAAQLAEAPLNQFGWEDALKSLAVVTGGWGGQLYGISGGRVLFDLHGGIPSEVIKQFETRGGTLPEVNPRVKAALAARPGAVLSEPDFISEPERRRNGFYAEFLDKVDTPYVAAGPLHTDHDCSFFWAVLRSANQGPPNAHQRRACEALIPHLSAAARLQVRLEGQAAALSLGALEHLSVPVILCDFAARIVGVSRAAESLLASSRLLVQRARQLHARSAECERQLQSALFRMANVANGLEPNASAVLVQSCDGEYAVADVVRLPVRTQPFGIAARTLVIVGAPIRRRSNALLVQLGLTQAEADIARALVEGHTPSEIAAARDVSLSTVRAQVKALHAKLEVRRQAELTARLRGLI